MRAERLTVTSETNFQEHAVGYSVKTKSKDVFNIDKANGGVATAGFLSHPHPDHRPGTLVNYPLYASCETWLNLDISNNLDNFKNPIELKPYVTYDIPNFGKITGYPLNHSCDGLMALLIQRFDTRIFAAPDSGMGDLTQESADKLPEKLGGQDVDLLIIDAKALPYEKELTIEDQLERIDFARKIADDQRARLCFYLPHAGYSVINPWVESGSLNGLERLYVSERIWKYVEDSCYSKLYQNLRSLDLDLHVYSQRNKENIENDSKTAVFYDSKFDLPNGENFNVIVNATRNIHKTSPENTLLVTEIGLPPHSRTAYGLIYQAANPGQTAQVAYSHPPNTNVYSTQQTCLVEKGDSVEL